MLLEEWHNRLLIPIESIDSSNELVFVLYYGRDNYIGEISVEPTSLLSLKTQDYEMDVVVASFIDL